MKVVGHSSELTELEEESPLRYASAPEGRAHAGTVSRCFSRGLLGFLSLVTSALPNFSLLFLKAYFLFSTLISCVCVHMHGYAVHTCGSQRTADVIVGSL